MAGGVPLGSLALEKNGGGAESRALGRNKGKMTKIQKCWALDSHTALASKSNNLCADLKLGGKKNQE